MTEPHATIPVSLTLIRLHPDAIEERNCPTCRKPMELHQPDAGLPDRMLWTCHQCATWFLMDIDPARAEAVLVCLPDHGYFHSAVKGPGVAPPGPLTDGRPSSQDGASPGTSAPGPFP